MATLLSPNHSVASTRGRVGKSDDLVRVIDIVAAAVGAARQGPKGMNVPARVPRYRHKVRPAGGTIRIASDHARRVNPLRVTQSAPGKCSQICGARGLDQKTVVLARIEKTTRPAPSFLLLTSQHKGDLSTRNSR
jgi:hypothetical protein